jgi:FlaG/FlaF family flagellin (archaellin)
MNISIQQRSPEQNSPTARDGDYRGRGSTPDHDHIFGLSRVEHPMLTSTALRLLLLIALITIATAQTHKVPTVDNRLQQTNMQTRETKTQRNRKRVRFVSMDDAEADLRRSRKRRYVHIKNKIRRRNTQQTKTHTTQRFMIYRSATTYGEAITLGMTPRDFRTDKDKQLVQVVFTNINKHENNQDTTDEGKRQQGNKHKTTGPHNTFKTQNTHTKAP